MSTALVRAQPDPDKAAPAPGWIVLIGVAAIYGYLLTARDDQSVGLACAGAILAGGGGLYLAVREFHRRAVIELTDERLVVPGLLYRRTIPRRSIARVVYVKRLITALNPGRPGPSLAVLDAAGKRLFYTRADRWQSSDLWLVALRLDVPITDFDLVGPSEVRANVRAGIPWRVAHAYLATMLVVAILFVVTLVAKALS